ncbi:MAG: hypothetical protein ABIA93_01680 [Candidatus Woesearchaeota archaeon]
MLKKVRKYVEDKTYLDCSHPPWKRTVVGVVGLLLAGQSIGVVQLLPPKRLELGIVDTPYGYAQVVKVDNRLGVDDLEVRYSIGDTTYVIQDRNFMDDSRFPGTEDSVDEIIRGSPPRKYTTCSFTDSTGVTYHGSSSIDATVVSASAKRLRGEFKDMHDAAVDGLLEQLVH